MLHLQSLRLLHFGGRSLLLLPPQRPASSGDRRKRRRLGRESDGRIKPGGFLLLVNYDSHVNHNPTGVLNLRAQHICVAFQ